MKQIRLTPIASRQFSTPPSDDDWAYIRLVWETDPRFGAQWLIDELSFTASRKRIIERAKTEGWKKLRTDTEDVSLEFLEQLSNNPPPSIMKKEVIDAEIVLDEQTAPDGTEAAERALRPVKGLSEDDYRQVFHLALLGSTIEQIADYFEVSASTVSRWMKENPTFSAAVKRGRVIADANVAAAVYKRAVGYTYEEKTFINRSGDSGSSSEDKVIERHVPPDAAMAKFWLTNRQPHLWKDKVEVREQIELNIGPSKEQLDSIYERADTELAAQNEMLRERIARLGIITSQQQE